jgi:flagellar P-ring protein precursor FlgI
MVMEKGVSVGDVAAALNAIGVTPQDVISIFQAVKAAGALQAELIVM